MLYSALYAAINNGKDNKKLVALSKTRWLVWGQAVNTVLDQFLELKTHFNAMAQATTKDDKCHMARVLAPMYNDEANELYLLFLKPILLEINRVNLLFQSQSAEVTELFAELRMLLYGVAKAIIKPCHLRVRNAKCLSAEDIRVIKTALGDSTARLPLHLVDFGDAFKSKLRSPSLKIKDSDLAAVKDRCRNFLVTLCREMVQRLPENLHLIEAVENLSVGLCISHTQQPKFSDLPLELAGKYL